MRSQVLVAALAGSLSACATTAPTGLPPVSVTASAETEPVAETAGLDAADDPAIWRNPADPAASLIVATDKKAGLYVYGLDGAVRSFLDAGRVNNVALAQTDDGVIVVASDRTDPVQARLALFRLDTAAARLAPLGSVVAGDGEAYGVCVNAAGGRLLAYSVLKDGTINEYALATSGAPSAMPLRTMKLATQSEGCVVDPSDGTLYVAEEDRGIWKFPPESREGQLMAGVDNRYLVADVEGLALLRDGTRGWLVASSQGDNAYAVFSLPDMAPLGRFAIVTGTVGGSEETDGIELTGGSFGPAYPDGLFVAQDGHNEPRAQNFKLVSWAAIKAALGLD